MVAEGPEAEGRSGVALPDALERKYPRAGHSAVVLGFAQHTHSTVHGAVSCVAITCMTGAFQRRKRAVEQA